ncbi:MAG: hypothetical protein ABSH20_06340 [Tepidisphaeraceae bacterium]|jgi:hypothetical protein
MSELRPPSSPQQPQQQSQQHGQGPIRPPGLAKVSGIPIGKPPTEDLESIALVEEPAPVAVPGQPASAQAQPASKIRAFTVAGAHVTSHQFKRQPNVTGHGATRVRTFHGRLSDEGMAFMDDKINEWIDDHPEVEIKHVSTCIGVFEGKIRDQALVVNIWY